jgi:hypothetical protein
MQENSGRDRKDERDKLRASCQGLRSVCESSITKLSPAGSGEDYPLGHRGLFPAVRVRQAQGRLYGTGRSSNLTPGLASWAKFSQSCPN